MPNAASAAATTPGWLRPRREPDQAWSPPRDARPDVRLWIVQEAGDALTAELVDGACPSRQPLLYVNDRGLFAIVATLLNGTRVYLRLRRWSALLEWSA